MSTLRRLGTAGALALLVLVAGCGAHTMPEVFSDSERLRIAGDLAQKRRYLDAVELLKAYVASAGGSARVDEAVFLLGDCYLKQKEYPLAQGEFERLLRDYPESDSSGSASFLLGEALLGQSRPRDFDQEFTRRAIEQWDIYLRDYPDHWRHAEGERRRFETRSRLAAKLTDTGELYLELKRWDPARVYYQRVLDEYPETAATADAEIGIAVCDAEQGRRDEAIARLRELETRLAGRPVAERAARERRRLEKKKV